MAKKVYDDARWFETDDAESWSDHGAEMSLGSDYPYVSRLWRTKNGKYIIETAEDFYEAGTNPAAVLFLKYDLGDPPDDLESAIKDLEG